MNKYAKDIATFTGSSIMLGAGSMAAGSFGMAGGLTSVGRMMPMMGTLITLKHSTRLLGKAMKKTKGLF
jgi:hypothetical protein